MEEDKIKELLQRYIEGTCTPEERDIVESWYLNETSANNQDIQVEDYDKVQHQLWSRIKSERFIETKRISWIPRVAAAIIVLALGVASYTYLKNDHEQETVAAVVPGGNKAVLTLANGEKIILSNLSNGEIAEQSGVKITKTKEGQIIYSVNDAGNFASSDVYNKIETPLGGKYQVNLPDGTKVWLNAGSSLDFPVSFKGKERVVKLSGEAYFDVAHNKAKPFKVVSANQIVEVLGTQFNVNSYADEPDTRTTLIEGSVRLSNHQNLTKTLKPGQRAVLTGKGIAIESSSIDQDISWINGDFTFEGSSLAAIMRQISRWYDVEVVYKGATADVKFGGSISMSKSLEEVLKVLEMTEGVNFKLEGRRVLVMP